MLPAPQPDDDPVSEAPPELRETAEAAARVCGRYRAVPAPGARARAEEAADFAELVFVGAMAAAGSRNVPWVVSGGLLHLAVEGDTRVLAIEAGGQQLVPVLPGLAQLYRYQRTGGSPTCRWRSSDATRAVLEPLACYARIKTTWAGKKINRSNAGARFEQHAACCEAGSERACRKQQGLAKIACSFGHQTACPPKPPPNPGDKGQPAHLGRNCQCCGILPGAAPTPDQQKEIAKRMNACRAGGGRCDGGCPRPPSAAPRPR